MHTNQSQEPCTARCREIVLERNRYFTGKYMTKRDFQGEQDYFSSRHRLHNRLFHGWGIVCGLEVVSHKDPDCRDRWVVVCPGIAIDCCGRELVLDKKTPVKIWDPPEKENKEETEPALVESSQQASMSPQAGYDQEPTAKQAEPGQQPHVVADDESETSGPGPFLLYLRYVEKEIECVPALYAEGTCDPTRKEANRVREIACLRVCRWDEVENSGWRMPEGDPERRCRDDCADPLPGPAGVCLEPECPDYDMVPLAKIQPRETQHGYMIEDDDIDTLGQRRLPSPGEFLTHIVEINWTHGGEVPLSRLRDPADEDGMGGRLEVRFDRKLLPAQGYATGINEFTFVVQYGGAQRDIEFLPSEPGGPILEDDCLAVFPIDPEYIGRRKNIAGDDVWVTLKCDFILDCHEQPVDGDYLKGRLPSGNGLPGGVFESWFRVVPDSRAYQEEK
jgi:hypothetical protein